MLASTFLTRKTGSGEPTRFVEDSGTVPSSTPLAQIAGRGEGRTRPSRRRELLRLLLHRERHRRPTLLIGVLRLDRLAILGHRHAVHANNFPVPLVGLFDRVVSDALQ